DAQLGYWVIRRQDCSLLRGLAPFLELHYNSTLGRPDMIQAGAFALGAADQHIDELNLSAGVVSQLGDNFLLSVGAVVPMRSAPDRTFDYQIGVHGSYFFGPTARNRNRATPVSSF